MKPLRAHELLGCLERHGVRYVLIGGLAAVLQGSPLPTLDADICPSRDADNLRRLADALRELDARVRVADVPAGLPFARDAAFLSGVSILNLTTEAGDLDLSFVPSGTEGFDDLDATAVTVVLTGTSVRVASVADIIRSKEAANRPKDQRALPVLRQLQQEIDKRKVQGR